MKPASIIIPAWNGARWIADCLRAIEPQRRPDDEVIVVDNGSTDATPDAVARDFPWARLVRLERNLGFSGGVNRGLAVARGDALILINQDVVLREGCLDALRQRLDDNRPAIVGCKLLYPDGRTIQHAGGIIRYPRAETDHRGYRQPDDGSWDTFAEVDYVTGAVFVLDRTVLRTVGLFDEGFYPAYYEEVDYCFRARKAGFAVIYEPSAVAIHHESQSHDTLSVAYYQAMQRGRLRFVLKNYTVEQLKSDFFPAEQRYVRSMPAAFAREVLASGYFNTLLNMPDLSHIVCMSDSPGAEQWPSYNLVGEIIASLSKLHFLALHPLKTGKDPMDDQLYPIQLPALHEHDFRSKVPVIGPLIRLARRGLYRLTSKWGVLVVIDQQNRINQMIAQYLMEYDRRRREYEARLIDQDRDLTYLSRIIAELEVRQRHLAKLVPLRPDPDSKDARET